MCQTVLILAMVELLGSCASLARKPDLHLHPILRHQSKTLLKMVLCSTSLRGSCMMAKLSLHTMRGPHHRNGRRRPTTSRQSFQMIAIRCRQILVMREVPQKGRRHKMRHHRGHALKTRNRAPKHQLPRRRPASGIDFFRNVRQKISR